MVLRGLWIDAKSMVQEGHRTDNPLRILVLEAKTMNRIHRSVCWGRLSVFTDAGLGATRIPGTCVFFSKERVATEMGHCKP
jgi:hypothetical protein